MRRLGLLLIIFHLTTKSAALGLKSVVGIQVESNSKPRSAHMSWDHIKNKGNATANSG
jgi:hypothetical protein